MPNIIIGKEEAFTRGFFFTDNIEQNIDLTNASYSGTSFSVSSEDTIPTGVAFNADGSKMFVVGSLNQAVYAYDLDSGFDVSTASFSGTSFNVSGETEDPNGVQFNGDGTKMFVVGRKNGKVYEYDLTTGFDVSTANSSTSFGLGRAPNGIQFNNDGTKLFEVENYIDSINEYDLTTGFDLSTASFSGTSFDVNSEEGTPNGVQFNGDGTKMFVIGRGGESVNQYDLTTGFDVSTASFSGTSFDVSSEDRFPEGLAFNTDGSKMFVVGEANIAVYEYTL